MGSTERHKTRPDNSPRKRQGLFLAVSRGLALFAGAFSLLNIIGELRYLGFDANHWWIDFRPILPLVIARMDRRPL